MYDPEGVACFPWYFKITTFHPFGIVVSFSLIYSIKFEAIQSCVHGMRNVIS